MTIFRFVPNLAGADRDAIYPLPWNCGQRMTVLEGLPRTNSVEGWHRAFQGTTEVLSEVHKLVEAIRLEQSHTENSIVL